MKNANDCDRRAERHAEGQIYMAIRRLSAKYPYHAAVLERFRVKSQPGIRTIGVAVSGEAILLLHNPSFVLSIKIDELSAVLLHEVHHLVFGHLTTDPAEFPDKWALTVAEEVTVNEFIDEPLPGMPILLEQFPGLPLMESTRERYARLVQSGHGRSALLDAGGGLVVGSDENSETRPGRLGTIVDNHSGWKNASADRETAESAIRAVLHDAAIEVGAENVPAPLQEALGKLNVGNRTQSGDFELEGGGKGSLPWVQMLRRYAGHQSKIRLNFRWPSRRRPELVGIVPGRRRTPGRPKIMAVIDTSFSMTPELLEQISRELARLATKFSVVVVECDAAINATYRFRQIKSIHGRGGTDLRPPFQPEFLRQHRPDLIVYFTDGEGPAPEKKPRPPVIWCLTADGVRPASWGRVIKMEETATGNGSRG